MQMKTQAKAAATTGKEETWTAAVMKIISTLTKTTGRMQMEDAAEAAAITGVEEPKTSTITILRMQIEAAAEAAVMEETKIAVNNETLELQNTMRSRSTNSYNRVMEETKIPVNNETLELQNTMRSRLTNSYSRGNIMCSIQELSEDYRGRALCNKQ